MCQIKAWDSTAAPLSLLDESKVTDGVEKRFEEDKQKQEISEQDEDDVRTDETNGVAKVKKQVNIGGPTGKSGAYANGP